MNHTLRTNTNGLTAEIAEFAERDGRESTKTDVFVPVFLSFLCSSSLRDLRGSFPNLDFSPDSTSQSSCKTASRGHSTLKIYTKTGDDGTTGLLGSRRVRKDNLRIETYGTVDELNAAIGVARSSPIDQAADSDLARIQDDLFNVGAALADPNPEGPFHRALKAESITLLEERIDTMEAELPSLTKFILPGGALAAAHVHLARTICRRAERLVVHLGSVSGEHVPESLIVYLNRLSDALFVIARAINHRAGIADVPWRGL